VEAFEELIRPHLPRVRRFAHAFTRNWADADDLAQDALLKAFRSIAAFEGRASLSTWLYTITRSVCLDYQRSRGARSRELEEPLQEESASRAEVSPLPGPEALAAGKSDAERLWAHLRTLAPEFRVPLVLYEIEGLAYDEIARIEGVPIGTVRSRLSRARTQLRQQLANEDEQRAVANRRRGTDSVASSSNPGSPVR
jgi:RNA polymerase sigma-70 factor (ECF subfamily)